MDEVDVAKLKKSFIALLLVSVGLIWWIRRPPSEEEVVGEYTGEHQGFVDHVELMKDHTFNQVLKTPDGETLTSAGTWRLTNKALDMDRYLFFIDEAFGGSAKPISVSVTFTAHRGMLIRDWDTGFYKLTQQ